MTDHDEDEALLAPWDRELREAADDQDSSSGSTSTSTTNLSWSSLAPSWLQSNTSTLRSFLTNPVGFIVGIALQALAGVIVFAGDRVAGFVDLVFFGGGPESLGLAEVPLAVVRPFGDAWGTAQAAVLDVVNTLTYEVAVAAMGTSPLALPLFAFAVVAIASTSLYVLVWALTLVPYVGRFFERLLALFDRLFGAIAGVFG